METHQNVETATSRKKETFRKASRDSYAVICTDWPRAKLEKRIASLPRRTLKVHVDGLPYRWIVLMLVTTLPKLEVLRITKTAQRLLGDSHKTLLEENSVILEIGYHRPERAWKDTDVRRKVYPKRSQWFQNLSSDQRKLFQELLALEDVNDADIASRYYCLNGEPYMPAHEVGKIFGYSPSCACSVVSFKVASVHKFLDEAVEAPADVCAHVKILKQKIEAVRLAREKTRIAKEKAVETARLARQRKNDQRRLLKAFGVESLPEGIPHSEIATYCLLHQLFWQGEVHACLARFKFKRGIKMLSRRYGLKDGTFRTYESLAQESGRTKESVRRTEARAFRCLGLLTYGS